MADRRRLLVLAVAALVLPGLAGCIGGIGGAGGAEGQPNGSDTNATGQDEHPQPTDQPHVHDRWDGRERRVLMDRSVTTSSPDPTDRGEPLLSTATRAFFGPNSRVFTLPEGEIVPPGTANLTITASWDAQRWPRTEVTRTRISMRYMPANVNHYTHLGEASGGQGTWTVETDVPMADGGHATHSLWRFRIVASDRLEEEPIFSFGTGRTVGGEFEIRVRIVANRTDGPLPLEPPHPDYWADGPVRPIAEASGQGSTVGAGVTGVEPTGSASVELEGTDHGIVPPGTRQLAAVVAWNDSSPSDPAARSAPELEWRNSGWELDRTWEPDRTEPGRSVYTMPLQEDDTDGMYANRSRWHFEFRIAGEDTGHDEPVFRNALREPWVFDGSWRLRIWAVNGTTLPAPVQAT